MRPIRKDQASSARSGAQAHMAVLFGPVTQVALAVLALGIIAVIGGFAVLLGVAVPVLGASLLLFVLLDAVIVGRCGPVAVALRTIRSRWPDP